MTNLKTDYIQEMFAAIHSESSIFPWSVQKPKAISLSGKHMYWGYLRIKCWREYLDLRERKYMKLEKITF